MVEAAFILACLLLGAYWLGWEMRARREEAKRRQRIPWPRFDGD
jgi:hypothetical protein